MTPRYLREARERFRAAADSLRLGVISGRAELREAGQVSAEAWELAERLADELEQRLGELEDAERRAGLR
jgi:hypothetical protein